MHRRGFILSACAAIHLVGPSHAQSEATGTDRSEVPRPTEGNGSVFQDLANLFKELSNIFATTTDVATKRAFAGSLKALDENLAQIIRAEHDILYALEHEPCSTSGETEAMRTAGWQASQVSAFVLVLSEQVRNIAAAVQPTGVHEHADRVAGKLLTEEANKYWAGNLRAYCQLPTDQQAAFLQDVRQVDAAIQAAGEELSKLVASLEK
jgi:hypothetical protein